MVAQIAVRIYGVNQVFRIAKGIRLNRQSRQIRFFPKKTHFTSFTSSELPSCFSTMKQGSLAVSLLLVQACLQLPRQLVVRTPDHKIKVRYFFTETTLFLHLSRVFFRLFLERV